jgi:preprotein translocase subunit SecB
MMALTGRRTVPQIFIGDTHVGGCDDLIALDQRRRPAAAAARLTPGAAPPGVPHPSCRGAAWPCAIIRGSPVQPSAAGFCHLRMLPTMADEATPVFQIQRMYLKDLSLEQPNSPQILLEQQQPQVDINLAMGAEPVADGIFEVTVTATVTTKVKDKTLFLVEAKQAGIFEIRNVPQEQMQGIISIVCPQMIYPYLRAIVSDVCTRAGFPPIMLTEVNFQAMFEAQQAQAAATAAARASSPGQLTRTPARAQPAADEDRRAGRRCLGHGAGHRRRRAPRRAAVGARRRAGRRSHAGATRCNRRYLPEVAFPDGLRRHRRPAARGPRRGRRLARHRHADGRPARHLAACRRARRAVAVQGLRGRQRPLGHEIARACGRAVPCGVLSGPSFAQEVARGQPTALVAASERRRAGRTAVQAFHSDSLRVYTSTDPSGWKWAAR